MISGKFEDEFPRVTLILPGMDGDFPVSCIVDTGFNGDLVLPSSDARRLEADRIANSENMTATGEYRTFPALYIEMPEYLEREVEVLISAGNPLIGTTFLRDQHLHVEMTDGGEVYSEPL